MFIGGDMLSQGEPLGHGGPASKHFCQFCLASLHDTNAAGVTHLCQQPPGQRETRSAEAARPAARAGSFSYAYQAAELAKAQAEYAAGKSTKKPEAKNYFSCVNPPLLWVDGPPEHSMSLYPLHLFLGLVAHQFNHFEKELKWRDAAWAKGRGRVLADAKAQANLVEAEATADRLQQAVEQHRASATSHANAAALIASDPANAEAVARAKSKPRAAPQLPFEGEFRQHVRDEQAALSALATAEKQLGAARQLVVQLHGEEAGPFMRAFYELMDSFNLERQAYHSGALNGNDCQRAFAPDAVPEFAALLAPRITAKLAVETSESDSQGGGAPRVRLRLNNIMGIADRTMADQFEGLWMLLSEAASLWTRKSPLCEHLMDRFESVSTQFAVEYAKLFPDQEAPPKLHVMLYHVLRQMRWLGGSGILHEGVVEAAHVVHNRHAARWANVKAPEQNIRVCVRAFWSMANPQATNIRALDQERETRNREHRSRDARQLREQAAQKRAERLARDEARAAA